MPVLEFGNWLEQVTSFYAISIPLFLYLNNYVGPKAVEPSFTKDFLMAHFEKISSQSSAGKSSAFVPTPGKAPKLPKNLFARSADFRGVSRMLKYLK